MSSVMTRPEALQRSSSLSKAAPSEDVQDSQTTPSLNKEQPPPNTTSRSLPDNAYMEPLGPWLTYLSIFLSVTVVSLIFGFYLRVPRRGGRSAWPSLAKWVDSSPRISALVVTILASMLAGLVKFAMSNAFAFVARKRLLGFRTIFEIEVLSSLKNRGVIWPWPSYNNRAGWSATVVTGVMVLAGGLLTSVFVSLLSPLRIPIAKEIVGKPELDFAATSSACSEWFDATILKKRNLTCDGWSDFDGFKYQRCDSTSQIFDVLEASKASMLAHIAEAVGASDDVQSTASTLTRLGNTRIVGSTAGVVPIGYAGISAFSTHLKSSLDNVDSSLSNFPFSPKPNYTLILQGLWADVSCEYTDPSSLPYPWPLLAYPDGQRFANVSCGPPSNLIYTANITQANKGLLVFDCLGENYSWNYYLHSFFTFNEPLDTRNAYAGVGSMKCTVTPRLRSIDATFHSNINAFTMNHTIGSSATSIRPVVDIFKSVADFGWFIFSNSQTPSAGNLIAYLIDSLAVSRLHLPGGVRDKGYPALVASMMKGIFEYEATNLRLILQTSENRPPEGCTRPVNGTVEYYVIGWNRALIPSLGLGLGVVMVALTVGLMFYAWEEGVTYFDPTNPVSLIGAASGKGLTFKHEIVDDPEDKIVRDTMVMYAALDQTRCGLVQQTLPPQRGDGPGV